MHGCVNCFLIEPPPSLSQDLTKALGAGLLPNPLAMAAAMAAAASSNPLALRNAAPSPHPHHHHHLLQATPLSHAILRPAPGPIRTSHGPILFSPYWHPANLRSDGKKTATPKAHCEEVRERMEMATLLIHRALRRTKLVADDLTRGGFTLAYDLSNSYIYIKKEQLCGHGGQNLFSFSHKHTQTDCCNYTSVTWMQM